MSSRSETLDTIERVVVFGIPKRCTCGHGIVRLESKSSLNPHRRYFRCTYAAEKHLRNDGHAFKWIDEALIDEIEALSTRMQTVEETVSRGMERAHGMVEEMILEYKLEANLGAKNDLKILLIVVVLGFLAMFTAMKLL